MLNMNFNDKVIINTHLMEWQASPMAGVWRKPLAREAAEHGHTTSVVHFEPGSYFSPHTHPMGEEILVLEGTFSDEHGDYHAGSYLRHPPGSRHKPFSKEGCVILVKLDQFEADDSVTLRLDTNRNGWLAGEDEIEIMPLHEHGFETVVLEKWPAGAKSRPHIHFGGEEIFIVSGQLFDEFGEYPTGTWVRNPHDSEHSPYVAEEALLWVKSGHLPTRSTA